MARPKMTCGDFSDCLKCPHCGGYVDDAKVSLQDICFHWPLAAFVKVSDDGYAHPDDYLQFDCSACEKPVAVAFTHDTVKLIACRTHKDEERLYGKYMRKGYGVAA